MNILLLGSGGREHAFAWKISQSPLCSKLFIAPGNPGTAQHGINLPVGVNDFEEIKESCLTHAIDMVVVGPEDPLVKGIYDFFLQDDTIKHIQVVGPSQQGAMLEGSKAFAKEFMQRHNIPTASYREFNQTNFDEGLDYLRQHNLPIVLKADGLAAGKGVVIAQSHEEAIEAFTEMLRDHKFGDAGHRVVIEQFLTGIECSVFILTDGQDYVLLPVAKDYKRIGEGDTGLNTGGMGAVSPVPFADEAFMEKVTSRIIQTTVRGLQQEKIVYKGFVFIGLISVEGEPYVIEYNCRMGDPETEVVLPRIENDLVELFQQLHQGSLAHATCTHSSFHAATIMLVSGGYPGDYQKGFPVSIPETPANTLLFHAGTREENGNLLTHGGRVLAATALGPALSEALAQARQLAAEIKFEGKYYRKDIGWEFV